MVTFKLYQQKAAYVIENKVLINKKKISNLC